MAGAATDSSRMGITLQGYDQVIALSQANINETLRRHFAVLDAKDELGTFEAEADPTSISAAVLAPTVELVDKDGADGALYIVHLGEGTYSTATKVGKKLALLELPTDGWELAFDIDFAFVPVIKIPDNIVRQVPLPGGYSVQQLMINFGDVTRIVQLDLQRSKFPIPASLEDKVSPTKIVAGLELFLREYLLGKLLLNEGHNVLGFAVKVDQTPKDQDVTFLPTSSKVQIIGHRTESKAESFRRENPYNAFCFTEMTDGRTMPSTEIGYSGNWFYDAIGGTLAMSRTLVWDSFLVKRFKDAHVKAVELSAKMLDKIASDKFEGKAWCVDGSKPTRDAMCGTYQGSTSWGALAYATTYKSGEPKHWNKDATAVANFWSSPRSTVHTLAKPNPRKGEIVIQQDVAISWEEGAELSNLFLFNLITAAVALAFKACVKGNLNLTLTTTLSFKAISSSGDLQVTSKTVTASNYKELEVRIGGLGEFLPDAFHKLMTEWAEATTDNYNEVKKTAGDEIKKVDDLFTGIVTALQDDLNKQNKFFFPGSGTFDMKDPIFSDKGDLMVGLTYR